MADMNIDVVDGIGRDGYARAVRRRLERISDPILVNSAASLVALVLGRLGGNRLRRLRIFGHGTGGQQGLGNSRAPGPLQEIAVHCTGHTESSCGAISNQNHLRSLTGHFARDGWVELLGCDVADGVQGRSLLRQLAALWNVPVKASEDDQFPRSARRGLRGQVVVAYPSGAVEVR
jgi:hypothetical protein